MALQYSCCLEDRSSTYYSEFIGNSLQAFSETMACKLNVHKDAVLFTAMCAMNAAVRGKVAVETPLKLEPINSFFALCAPSGYGKSLLNEFMKKPLVDYQEAQNRKVADQAEKLAMERKLLSKQIRSLERKITADVSSEERASIAAKILQLQAKIPHHVRPLTLFVDDITTGGLLDILALQGGRIAVMEPEISILRTLLDNKRMNKLTEIILRAFSGEPISRTRKGGEHTVIHNPRIAINVMVQPAVLKELLRANTMLERGMVARFMIADFKHMLVPHIIQGQMMPFDEANNWYRGTIAKVLERVEAASEDIILRLSEEAASQWNSLSAGPVSHQDLLYEWIKRAKQHCLHLAAFLHLFKHPERNDTISGESMAQAINILNVVRMSVERVLWDAYPAWGYEVACEIANAIRRLNRAEGSRFFLKEARSAITKKHSREEISQALSLLVSYNLLSCFPDIKGNDPKNLYQVNVGFYTQVDTNLSRYGAPIPPLTISR